MCIDATIKQIETMLLYYFEIYPKVGFIKSTDLAKNVAFEMNVKLIFPTKRPVKYFEINFVYLTIILLNLLGLVRPPYFCFAILFY